jgi:protein-S-isoprenylcysteine O-methyltransferase Ste14
MKEKNGEHPFGDAGQLIFLAFFLVVWVVDSFFLRKSTFLANNVQLYIRMVILVLSLMTAALLFRSGLIEVSHEHRPTDVVYTGAFRYVRHPLYLGCILFYLALAVSTFSLLSLVLLVLIFLFYNYIAGYEEKLLVQKFGEKYSSNKRSTGKWMPRIGRRI